MQFLRIIVSFFLSTIISLIPTFLVILAILFAVEWGGIFHEEFALAKLIPSWTAIWLAISFYCRTKNYKECEK